jgi:CCCH-type zinc finger
VRFSNVVRTAHPEPRTVLVQTLTRLCKHQKSIGIAYPTWQSELTSIFNSLTSVQFAMNDDFKIGFTYAMLEHDKRYTVVIERACEKKWNYEESLIHFNRVATKISDTKPSGHTLPPGLRINATEGEVNVVEVPVTDKRKRTRTDDDNQAEIKKLKQEIELLKKQKDRTPSASAQAEPCRTFLKHGKCTWGDKCRHSHSDNSDQKSTQKSKEKCRKFLEGTCTRGDKCLHSHETEDDAEEKLSTAERTKLRKAGKCYTHFASKGSCAQGDSCLFSHEQ